MAQLAVTLASIDVQGKSYDIETSTFNSSAKSHNKRNAGFIGGGAAGGALIGGLAKCGKGASIGGAIGAGAGTAGAAATGQKDVSIPAETSVDFRLTQSLTVSVKGRIQSRQNRPGRRDVARAKVFFGPIPVLIIDPVPFLHFA